MAYAPGTTSSDPTGPTAPAPELFGRTGEEWIALGKETASLWQKLTGQRPRTPWGTAYNNAPYQTCPDTPNFDAVLRAVQRAPDAEIGTLIGYLQGANNGQGPGSRAALAAPMHLPAWVKAIMGGKDCKATKYPEAPDWFRTFVGAYGAPTTAEQDQPGGGVLPWTPADTGGGATAGTLLPLAAGALALWFVPRMLGKARSKPSGWRL